VCRRAYGVKTREVFARRHSLASRVLNEYAYDAATGRRIAVTDPLANTVYTAYDLQGRVATNWGATYPVCYDYDASGRMGNLG